MSDLRNRDRDTVCVTDCVGTEGGQNTTKDKLIAMMVLTKADSYYTRDYLPPGEIVLK